MKMLIGQRVKQLREQKGLSQGDLEKFSGMLRTYISRVENCHSVPSLHTLKRFATALDVPLYQLFSEAEVSRPTPNLTPRDSAREVGGPNGPEDGFLAALKLLAARMAESDRTLLLDFATRLARRHSRVPRPCNVRLKVRHALVSANGRPKGRRYVPS
jgi:transcriptional regulator with XRE-family HTH domain